MIKEQIDVEILTTNFEANLLADKRETCAQFEQELPDVGYETSLNLSLLGLLGRCKKLEVVGILQQLTGKIGLETGQGALEVCARLALSLIEIALDPVYEDIPAPAVFSRRSGIPKPLLASLDLLDQCKVVVPGVLCKRLLHN
jgi:hypothetical protein